MVPKKKMDNYITWRTENKSNNAEDNVSRGTQPL